MFHFSQFPTHLLAAVALSFQLAFSLSLCLSLPISHSPLASRLPSVGLSVCFLGALHEAGVQQQEQQPRQEKPAGSHFKSFGQLLAPSLVVVAVVLSGVVCLFADSLSLLQCASVIYRRRVVVGREL